MKGQGRSGSTRVEMNEQGGHTPHISSPPEGRAAIDPVCGMSVDPTTALSAEAGGKTYYFCSEGCRTKFVADPSRYLDARPFAPAGSAHPSSASVSPSHFHPQGDKEDGHNHHRLQQAGRPVTGAVDYTCPMHPQIVRDGPGV